MVFSEDHEKNRIYQEIVKAGYRIMGVGERFQVPYVEIVIPPKESIISVCRRVPSLNQKFFEVRHRIAYFNVLNPFYLKTPEEEPYSINTTTLKIPLDLTREPVIFPPYEESLARYEKYLLIDLGKEYLALYAYGRLLRTYPISPGTAGPGTRSTTPLLPFTILSKHEHFYSEKYDDAWMPYSLQVHGPYYIHGGVLPGRPDSHGCIRMFLEHARELFDLVEVGTPGRIINSATSPVTARLDGGSGGRTKLEVHSHRYLRVEVSVPSF